MTTWDALYWVEENYWIVAIAALALVVIYFAVRTWRKSAGHADDPLVHPKPGHDPFFPSCCLCDHQGLYDVPIVGRSAPDVWFERGRRIEGIAPRYRIVHDASDPRRLCTLHYREHKEKLLTEFDEVRVECVALNRRHWTRLNALTLDREAPVVEPPQPVRVKNDSSIELEPIQGSP